jgi:hypothetical protein
MAERDIGLHSPKKQVRNIILEMKLIELEMKHLTRPQLRQT